VLSKNFYTIIEVAKYQENSDVINDVIDYVLCCALSNELFIKIIFSVVSTMGKIYYEDKMCTLCEISIGCKAVVAKFPTKMC